MEMREIIEKILENAGDAGEVEKCGRHLGNAGDILEMWESPAQCGRVDSYVDQISKTIWLFLIDLSDNAAAILKSMQNSNYC